MTLPVVWTLEPATGAGLVVVVEVVVVVVGATVVVVVGTLVVVVVVGAGTAVVVVVATSLRTGESAMDTAPAAAVTEWADVAASPGPAHERAVADDGRALAEDAAASVPPWISRSVAISTAPQRSSPT